MFISTEIKTQFSTTKNHVKITKENYKSAREYLIYYCWVLRLDFSLSSCEFSNISFPFCTYVGRYALFEDKHHGSRHSTKTEYWKQQYRKCYYSTVTFAAFRKGASQYTDSTTTVPCALVSSASKTP
jgi:hypothetical protein